MTTYNHKAIAAAKECFDCYEDGRGRFEYSADEYGLERFYAIAFEAGRVAEREECAKVCEDGTSLMAFQSKICYSYAYNRAKAIRARGDTK